MNYQESLEHLERRAREDDVDLAIGRLHGIEIDEAILSHCDHRGFTLQLRYDEYECSISDSVLENVFKKLAVVKFHKAESMFYCPEVYDMVSARVHEATMLYPEASKYQDCIVCYEKTSNRTRCNHMLCQVCLSQLKTDDCPMCRASLS